MQIQPSRYDQLTFAMNLMRTASERLAKAQSVDGAKSSFEITQARREQQLALSLLNVQSELDREVIDLIA